jgi:hypothetical protein
LAGLPIADPGSQKQRFGIVSELPQMGMATRTFSMRVRVRIFVSWNIVGQ